MEESDLALSEKVQHEARSVRTGVVVEEIPRDPINTRYARPP